MDCTSPAVICSVLALYWMPVKPLLKMAPLLALTRPPPAEYWLPPPVCGVPLWSSALAMA